MKRLIFTIVILCAAQALYAQQNVSKYVVVVTMDGLRWQEVFLGADSLLTQDTAADYPIQYIMKHFWAPSIEERRQKLFPFLWSEVARGGIILGNRTHGNYFDNANPYWFSYPGYNELFAGFPDTTVNSNDKIPNRNETVLEYLNKLPEFKNRIAVFGSWDVFASIFNEKRSGLLVNDGFRSLPGSYKGALDVHNKLQHEMPDLFHGGERLDAATFNIGFEYMRLKHPRVIYFALGDTDEFAHSGKYDYYLDAAQKADNWIRRLWEFIQSSPVYSNKTTLIITTDHGRGAAEGGNWKHHGRDIPGSGQMWMAAIGPSVRAAGENKSGSQLYQGQLAATIALMLGKEFRPAHQVLPPLKLND